MYWRPARPEQPSDCPTRAIAELGINVYSDAKTRSGATASAPKGDDFFSNVNCQYNDVALVPLNDAERYNVAAIKKVEASKGCL